MKKTLYTQQYAILLAMLREARAKVGLTQADVAKKLRVSQSDVSKCELGQRRLDVVELKLWVETLGVPLTEFLTAFEARLPDNLATSQRRGGSARKE
jgi:transcriptional regulator with XRE-family HTH domain